MNETRRQLLDALAAVSEADPELRMGQLIVNLVNYIDWTEREQDVWNVEDEELLKAAKGLTKTLLERKLAVA